MYVAGQQQKKVTADTNMCFKTGSIKKSKYELGDQPLLTLSC